jgi:phosphonoacetaldehyde hydrolase
MTTSTTPGVKLVVFDWAGTLIDHGCVAPVQALQATFEARGLSLSKPQIRGILGLGIQKREVLEHLLRIPSVQRSFGTVHGRAPQPADVEELYAAYLPAQLAAIRRRSELIDGALASFAGLREQHIAIATTSCYFRAAADLVLECARRQELVPDFAVCSDDVPAGRPAPFMIHACMQALAVQQAREVLVVGDTALDILTARNAGCLSTGVAGTGNDVGVSSSEWDELTLPVRNSVLANAHRTLRDAGADFVIDTLSELPLVIRRIAERGLSSAA